MNVKDGNQDYKFLINNKLIDYLNYNKEKIDIIKELDEHKYKIIINF